MTSLISRVNPLLIVRNPLSGRISHPDYWVNMADLKDYVVQELSDCVSSLEDFDTFMLKAHSLAVLGADQQGAYTGVRPRTRETVAPGEFRSRDAFIEDGYLESIAVAESLFDIEGSEFSRGPGKLEEARTLHRVFGSHFPYVDSSGNFNPAPIYERVTYFQAMLSHFDALSESDSNDEKLDHIGQIYQLGISFLPFNYVNNSVMMTITNYLLDQNGFKQIPHFKLDQFAQRFDPDYFGLLFRTVVNKAGLNVREVMTDHPDALGAVSNWVLFYGSSSEFVKEFAGEFV